MPFAALRALFAGRLPALVMFDLDGTLIDSVPDIARALDATLRAHDLPPAGEARVRQWVGRGSRQLLREALGFAAGIAPAGVDAEPLGRALETYQAIYLRDCTRDTRMLPGAAELVAALHGAGVKTACVTNKPQAITVRVLEHFALLEHFDAVLGGGSGVAAKPDPAPLVLLMERLGVDADQALMVGDSRHDVRAARAAKVAVICRANGYNHGEDIRAEDPDAVVSELRELL
jgi:phosphoglycolate phosphatase